MPIFVAKPVNRICLNLGENKNSWPSTILNCKYVSTYIVNQENQLNTKYSDFVLFHKFGKNYKHKIFSFTLF